MEARSSRIRLCRQRSKRLSRFSNECRDVHSPIGSWDDACDVRNSNRIGKRFDSTDDLSRPDHLVTGWIVRPPTPVFDLEWDPVGFITP